MTKEEILKRFPHASPSFLAANTSAECSVRAPRVSAPQPQPDPGRALDRVVSRKDSGGKISTFGAFVAFHVYSTRPRDWDNSFTKPLQDLLVEVGLLGGDDWQILGGIVVPHKVKTKKEECTVIEIWYEHGCPPPDSQASTV